MQFYSDIVSSESDYEEEEIVDEVEETAPQIKSKWLATTESMDDEDDNRGVSKESRSEEQIKKICFDLEQFVDNENWRDAQKHFDTALNLAVAHKSKFGVECEAFLETLSELSELPENVKTHPEMEENARSRNTLRNLKLLIKQVTEIYPKYEKAIEVMENGGEDEDENDDLNEEVEDGSAEFDDTEADSSVPHDFDYFLSEISKSLSSKEKTSRLLQRIATSSARNGFPAIEASASGMTAHALIMENTKLTFPISTWRSAFAFTVRCFKIVKANPTFTVTDDLTSISPTRVAVNGGLPDLLRLLSDKLAQMTQFSKHLEPDHFALPTYENDFAGLIDNVICYYQERNQRSATIACASVLIDILGQRTQSAHDLLYPKLNMSCHIITASIIQTVKELHRLLHQQRDEMIKMRAACYVAYQFALAGQYHEAADFIRRCGVQDFLDDVEDHTMLTPLFVLYNRVLAQVGLAAFYEGDIEQTYEILGSLWSFDQPEVLIGQAVPYGVERMAAEIELKYRELLVPLYYRIPAQKLELAAMLSALAIDSVREAFTPYERSRLQRYFYQAITRRTQLTGKPALPHDQIAAAYHALKNGNYQDAKKIVWSMSAWSGIAQKEEVFDRYCTHLREAALRIFCYSNRNNFSSYSVTNLAMKFEISKQKVRDVINQMLTESSELIAYWDRDDEFLFIDRNNTTRLQHLLIGTADSVIKLAPYAEPRTRLGDDDNTRRMGNRNNNNNNNNNQNRRSNANNNSNNAGNNNRGSNRYNMRAR